MIELKVEPYCHRGCPDFEPEVEKIKTLGHRNAGLSPKEVIKTIVMCKHRNRCYVMKKYLSEVKC